MENLKGWHLTNNPVQQDWADEILRPFNEDCGDVDDYANYIAILDKIREEAMKMIMAREPMNKTFETAYKAAME